MFHCLLHLSSYDEKMKKDHQSKSINFYLRFLKLVSAVQLLPGMDSFDANSKVLFEQIMLAWAKDMPLTVRDAMGMEHLGSPATLHKRLVQLREMQLVDAISKDNDRRTKYLIPTEKGLEYVSKLGQAFSLSFKSD